ncbi:MAG: DUF2029 domain-containing protein [Planctomycetota bacterium]|nr:DUF2029 domain-containing protein [Planctomycetota bacterium]
MVTQRFNRGCRGVGLFLLLFFTLWRFHNDPAAAAHKDFAQYYMGGLIARYHKWGAMYPIPHADSVNNPGDPRNSEMVAGYAQLAQEYRVGMPREGAQAGREYDENRFIQAPPMALLFIPLTLLPYMKACVLWQTLMALCGWGIAVIAGRFYQLLHGSETPGEGAVVLLTAVLSPAMRRSLIPGNISAAMGLMIALSVYGLVRRDQMRAAGTILLGGLMKYATGMLVPLALAMRQFKLLIWMFVGALLLIVASVAIEGVEPFRHFVSLLPSLDKPWYERAFFNQSIYGLIFSITNQIPSPGLLAGIKAVQWITLVLVLAAVFRRKVTDWENPALVISGATALMAWYCIFSPLFWTHYATYLLAFFGWLCWEAQHGPLLRRVAAALAIAITFVPAGVNAMQHQPATTYMLWCSLLLLIVAISRLIEGDAKMAGIDPQFDSSHEMPATPVAAMVP